jgi:divalent metal cation (Fe/Co/Zn/Cd) transporter
MRLGPDGRLGHIQRDHRRNRCRCPVDPASLRYPSRVIDRPALLRRALGLSVLSIVVNGIAGGLAVIVGATSGSLSLLGFGFDAAIDSAASIALVWRFSIEAREPHRAERVEKIAEAIVGVVLLVLAAYLGFSAIRALIYDTHPEGTLLGTGLLLVSVIILPPIALAKYRVARRLASGALRADSILTAIAALLAFISLVGLGLTEAFGLVWADAIGALVVTAILVREGWGSLQATRRPEPIQ